MEKEIGASYQARDAIYRISIDGGLQKLQEDQFLELIENHPIGSQMKEGITFESLMEAKVIAELNHPATGKTFLIIEGGILLGNKFFTVISLETMKVTRVTQNQILNASFSIEVHEASRDVREYYNSHEALKKLFK